MVTSPLIMRAYTIWERLIGGLKSVPGGARNPQQVFRKVPVAVGKKSRPLLNAQQCRAAIVSQNTYVFTKLPVGRKE
jgi:hypothetical protein